MSLSKSFVASDHIRLVISRDTNTYEEARPGWGRRRAPALGSAGVRAVERAAGMETGEGYSVHRARPLLSAHLLNFLQSFQF